MSDLISRRAAIDFIDAGHLCNPNEPRWSDNEVVNFLKSRPSADVPRWIPVTERLPEDDTLMLVNYIDHRPEAMDIWIGWHEMENVWYIDGEAHSREYGNEVIAWMPLPEPYKGDE